MRQRLTFAAGSVIVIGSIIIAATVRAPRVTCSRLAGAPVSQCPQPANDVMFQRVGIVAAGLIVAVFVIIGGRIWDRRHR